MFGRLKNANPQPARLSLDSLPSSGDGGAWPLKDPTMDKETDQRLAKLEELLNEERRLRHDADLQLQGNINHLSDRLRNLKNKLPTIERDLETLMDPNHGQ